MELFIGLDLGGTNLKYALGTKNGEVVKKQSRPSQADQSQHDIFENIFFAVEELKAEAKKQKDTILSIGLGSPGSINFDTGQLKGSTPNLPNWSNAPIKKTIEEKFNIPTWADNDANIMALAEARIGAGKRFKNILCLTLGTGIGGGILINNQILRGEHFSAAEVGHIIVDYNGKRCNCGNKGCLEAYTTAPAMVRRYEKKHKDLGLLINKNDLNTEYIFKKAKDNDSFAKETISETCGYLSAGIASIANIIDPEVVIIGGGVSEAGDSFIKQIEESIKQYSIKAIMQNLKVVKAQMGNDAGIVGAILLAAENYSRIN